MSINSPSTQNSRRFRCGHTDLLNKVKSMLPMDICRTCTQHDDSLLPLATCTDKYANKSLNDMLHELTQNDEHTDDSLPQHLCIGCLHKLEAAYAFVLQARQAQEQLLLRLHKGLQTQCLDEMPIDINLQQIKIETIVDMQLPSKTKSDDEREQDMAAVSIPVLKWQPESDNESDQTAVDQDEDLKPTQVRRSARKFRTNIDNENEAASGQANPLPNKRRRGRPAHLIKKETVNEEGRHVCDVCGKTFSWYRDMQRHSRIHFEQATYVCDSCGKSFLRKDKYMFHLRSHEKRAAKSQAMLLSSEWRFAERLYSSSRLKRAECKLCGLKYRRIGELRQHLSSHNNIETLSNLSLESDVIKEQFDRDQRQLDLALIKQQLCADIAKGRAELDKYCAVVNAYGYELSLSDSDEEVAQYQCQPCNTNFSRKYRLMRHTLEEHTQAETAFSLQRCDVCQIGFVCANMLEQHQRTQCFNKLKRYNCPNCPGKFIWLQNLEQHACSHHIKQLDGEHQIKQCCLCDAQLNSMIELRTHLLTHQDGRCGIYPEQQATFFRTYYPNGLDCSLSDLSTVIAADFKAENYGRYFNARTKNGEELDFFASDSDLSDADQQSSETTLHICSVCGETKRRLSRLLEHQKSKHSQEQKSLPYVCGDCDLSFVANSLLQQHRRRVCDKQHAKYHCQQCSQRFYWFSNYKLHMHLQHETQAEAQTDAIDEYEQESTMRSKRQSADAKLQCGECEKVFIWHKDLTRHKRLHQPQALAQYHCVHCDRKFHRKDGLKSHMRVHGEHEVDEAVAREPIPPALLPVLLAQLCRPNGCKQIQCMICLSQHTKISDLRTHLLQHQYTVKFAEERGQPESIASISRSLYPELSTPLEQQQLIERIQSDVAKGVELERFISITNEAGIELSLDSSETETDSDSTETVGSNSGLYSCELCQLKVSRKHQLYAHQLEQHSWQQATRVCNCCQARFVNEQLLEHHYRTLCRNVQRRFFCRKCPLRFRWRENLKLHSDVAHNETRGEQSNLGIHLNGSRLLPIASYDCTECHRSFKMQKDLTRHTLMHAQESSIYRCRWCARRFYRHANLLQHIERHGIIAEQLPYAEALLNASRNPHGQKCIQCMVCNVTYPTIAALRSHLLSAPTGTHHEFSSLLNYSITNQLGYELLLDDSETDEEAKPPGTPAHYTCGMCQLRCVRKFELHQHQQAMHRLERINEGCDVCIFKSVSPDIVAYHRRVLCDNTEKRFKCSKCGYKFMWEANLLQHMQLQHPSSETQQDASSISAQELPSADSQIFQCGQCPSKYNRKDRLTAHVKKCHMAGTTGATAATDAKAMKNSTGAKQQKSFLCAFCGKAVSSSSNLIIHIRRHTGEKPFKCDYCDMAFPRSSDLQCHRRTHTGERPHVCTVCQKGFARSYKLQQHMRIHNGERPYKCTYCEKSFTQSNDLTLHIRRHTGERPYQCNTCGERFIQGTALKNHRLQHGHHDMELEQIKDN
ncbi:zinc finger protein Xfin isoform X2 [Drosophila hydei]|uniref:Zinc finger protein Xfin isoform X2 n=1 Tax=Drosophila hydei TaxID=7224 RepID=A0A6J1MPD2_DROHY|nr:zinc finger protein Xfin isoform X2 [Drosophila hydei]